MFRDHFARAPQGPPASARLNTPFESAAYAALRDGCLMDFEALCLAARRDGDCLAALSRKALKGVVDELVRAGFAVEVSGHRLDGLARR